MHIVGVATATATGPPYRRDDPPDVVYPERFTREIHHTFFEDGAFLSKSNPTLVARTLVPVAMARWTLAVRPPSDRHLLVTRTRHRTAPPTSDGSLRLVSIALYVIYDHHLPHDLVHPMSSTTYAEALVRVTNSTGADIHLRTSVDEGAAYRLDWAFTDGVLPVYTSFSHGHLIRAWYHARDSLLTGQSLWRPFDRIWIISCDTMLKSAHDGRLEAVLEPRQSLRFHVRLHRPGRYGIHREEETVFRLEPRRDIPYEQQRYGGDVDLEEGGGLGGSIPEASSYEVGVMLAIRNQRIAPTVDGIHDLRYNLVLEHVSPPSPGARPRPPEVVEPRDCI